MKHDELLEHELASHLRARAVHAPGGDGWDGILTRVDQRHRRRQRRRATATALCVVALAGAVLSLGNRIGSDRGPVPTSPVAPAATTLPHLVLEVAGYELDHASEAYFGPEDQPAPASPDRVRLSVLTEPGRGYDGRVLFVTTAGPGYGVGDRSGAAQPVDVDGRTGWLQRYTALPVSSLGWYLADGQAVHLVALRMPDDDVLTAARNAVVGPDGSISWRDALPPAGLVLQRFTEAPIGPRATAEVTYVRGGERLVLRLQAGGQAVLDELVRDRAAAAIEIGETTVDGMPAVVSRYEGEDRASLMWEVRPGVVAELVAANTTGDPDILQAAATITEIDETAWQGLLERFLQEPPQIAPSADTANRVLDVVRSTCDLRGTWLAADVAGREAAVTELDSFRRHAVETGLDRDTDVVAVIDRLLAAMTAGDAATVGSIPEGGACG